MQRKDRASNELRKINIEVDASPYAEGSCLISFGNTRVLCTASVEERIPPFLRNTGKGWVTAEYGMLPRSTHTRSEREAARGKQSGRTQEIQRLIGRSLRSVIDLSKIGERQIIIDCDVINADGGTRTASITGGYVALYRALQKMQKSRMITSIPVTEQIAAVSCGIYNGEAILDLDYEEDSNAEADSNFVITSSRKIVEVQGTAEKDPFTQEMFLKLLGLAQKGTEELIKLQKIAIGI